MLESSSQRHIIFGTCGIVLAIPVGSGSRKKGVRKLKVKVKIKQKEEAEWV